MTLPAEREQIPQEPSAARPVKEPLEIPNRREAHTSPANHLLAMLEDAHLGAEARGEERRGSGLRASRAGHMVERFGSILLVWSFAALFLSVGILTFETLEGDPLPPAPRPPLEFRELTTRHVQSSEGPALELAGLVHNAGKGAVEPEVVLQLAGNRVAIEEPLRLGADRLPPGAERPFTVRLLLPQGTQTVSLLPIHESASHRRSMPLVSPAWTAGGAGL